jgi:hypothetical protein
MGVSIEYRLAGQEVDREQFLRAAEERVGRAALEGLRARAERIRCLRHGRHARVTQVRVTADAIEVRLAGCCEDLVECALRELD